jgi:S-methylmethionine-dependent homocysteine/selenocysteine methylase
LPQLDGGLFITDGGIETSLIFNDGLELPDFAAFDLLRRPGGEPALRRYFRAYARIAARFEAGLILESATWRASADWGLRLGYDPRDLDHMNRRAIALLEGIRDELKDTSTVTVISGCIGPRGDGYVAGAPMALDDAQRVHQPQVDALVDAGADMITAITMTTSAEGIGVARAAARAGRPSAISFTLETDGTLPSGESLRAAIDAVDADAAAGGRVAPAYYMINCAHPSHFERVLGTLGERRARLRGVRANASRRSHAELDSATELDAGDPQELGRDYLRLKSALPDLCVVGGCCGTDHRHVAAMSSALVPPR